MNIDEVQAMAAFQIAANTALAAFGTPITFSDLLDDETTQASIATALREKGVILEISEPEFDKGEGTPGRFEKLDAHFIVSAAENPKVSHTPSGMSLVKTIVQALTKKISNYEAAPICTGTTKSKSDQGYVLHEISFMATVLVR